MVVYRLNQYRILTSSNPRPFKTNLIVVPNHFFIFFWGGGQSETGWSNHPWIVIHQEPSVCFHFPTMTPFYSFAVVHEKKWIKEITSIAL